MVARGTSTAHAAPALHPENVTLRDGSTVRIARIAPADAPLIADGFGRLSAETRRLRFLTSKPSLSSTVAQVPDRGGRAPARGARGVDPDTGHGIAVARFVRDDQDPARAEVAVTVADEWSAPGPGHAAARSARGSGARGGSDGVHCARRRGQSRDGAVPARPWGDRHRHRGRRWCGRVRDQARAEGDSAGSSRRCCAPPQRATGRCRRGCVTRCGRWCPCICISGEGKAGRGRARTQPLRTTSARGELATLSLLRLRALSLRTRPRRLNLPNVCRRRPRYTLFQSHQPR